MPQLTRLIYTYPDPLHKPKLILVDGDKIEPKNTLRQNFANSDIGKNKAQVLAERYAGGFGMPVRYLTEFIDKATLKNLIVPTVGRIPLTLIIDCLDNKRTRKIISEVVSLYSATLDWLSLGNDKDTGQLVFTSESVFGSKARSIVTLFPEDYTAEALAAEEAEANAQNCAVVTISQPQTIAINHMGAMVAVNYLYQMFFDKEVTHDVVFYNRNNTISSLKVGQKMTIEKPAFNFTINSAAQQQVQNQTPEPPRELSLSERLQQMAHTGA